MTAVTASGVADRPEDHSKLYNSPVEHLQYPEEICDKQNFESLDAEYWEECTDKNSHIYQQP